MNSLEYVDYVQPAFVEKLLIAPSNSLNVSFIPISVLTSHAVGDCCLIRVSLRCPYIIIGYSEIAKRTKEIKRIF